MVSQWDLRFLVCWVYIFCINNNKFNNKIEFYAHYMDDTFMARSMALYAICETYIPKCLIKLGTTKSHNRCKIKYFNHKCDLVLQHNGF